MKKNPSGLLTIIEAGDLTPKMIGRRVVVVEGTNTFDGTLEEVWASMDYKKNPKVTHIEVSHGNGLLKLKDLPMDFKLQIELVDKKGFEIDIQPGPQSPEKLGQSIKERIRNWEALDGS